VRHRSRNHVRQLGCGDILNQVYEEVGTERFVRAVRVVLNEITVAFDLCSLTTAQDAHIRKVPPIKPTYRNSCLDMRFRDEDDLCVTNGDTAAGSPDDLAAGDMKRA